MPRVPGPATAGSDRPALRHLGVIPDGNRRWAHARGLPTVDGHQRGGERSMELLGWCRKVPEIEIVTLWVMSIENYSRSPEEVEDGLRMITDFVDRIATGRQWRIGLIGDLDILPPQLAAWLRNHSHNSRTVSGPLVNIAIAYSGRNEITRAVQRLLDSRAESSCPLPAGGRVDPAEFARHLDTAGQPDPDLIIRTSGETRLSGFMPWQTLHSELYFSSALWPDFDEDAFDEALAHYQGRQRRKGL
ncbi:di-trans,poly-cis-decaprenylcistransferase [Streptomyces agglomeratus]|nr:di-trans,poly-cis-decaprenylcistransferase [Streptomyces agglomeratus]OEJ36914.1 di-trans,poly-cis-decaprenylcistransferase [Streptomyces agglomeratus]